VGLVGEAKAVYGFFVALSPPNRQSKQLIAYFSGK
jgi:hypothetical protein